MPLINGFRHSRRKKISESKGMLVTSHTEIQREKRNENKLENNTQDLQDNLKRYITYT